MHTLARAMSGASVVNAANTRVLLHGATIVHHDSVDARSVTIDGGAVAARTAIDMKIDLRDHLIFPGLINAHDHLQLNSIPPLPHDAPFLNSYAWIDAFEPHLQSAEVVAARQVPTDARHWHGGLKNVLAGATTVAHHDPQHVIFDEPAFPVRVLTEFGWSHSLGLGDSRDGGTPRYGPSVRESFCATPSDLPWVIHLAEGT
ncbi:MAG: hypothetical protein ABJE10_13825, partial [bacterium]